MAPRLVLIPSNKHYADMSEAELQVCAADLGAGGRDHIDRAIECHRGCDQPTAICKDLYVQVDDGEAASVLETPPRLIRMGKSSQTVNNCMACTVDVPLCRCHCAFRHGMLLIWW